MASSSTISATFKLNADASSLKELIKDSDGLKKALAGAVQEADKAPAKFSRLNSSAKSIAANFAKMAAGFIGLKAAASGLRDVANTLVGFERANSELASVLGTNLAGVEDLTQAAQELGRATMYSASEVTALQTALARLGFTKTQINDMQGAVLRFAAATGTDLASAADFTGSALRSFGMEANEANALLDVMAKSTSASALSFSKLQVSMSTVGPVANAFGLTARDTVALLGVLSNAGFDASSGATALRNILLNLADANGKLAKGLGHTAKTMPEILDALKELRDRGVDLNATLEMTDKRSVAAFNAFIDGADSAAALYEQLGNANGALNEMYGTMTDNVAGAIDSVKSAWEGLVLTMSSSTGPIKDVLNRFARGLNVITSMIGGSTFKGAQQENDIQALRDQGYSREQLQDIYAQLQGKTRRTGAENRTMNAALILANRMAQEQQLAALESLGPVSYTPGGAGGGSGAGADKALDKQFRNITNKVKAWSKRVDYEMRKAMKAEGNGGIIADVIGLTDEDEAELDAQLDAITQALLPQAQALAAYQTAINNTEAVVGALASTFGDFGAALDGQAASWAGWISKVLQSIGQAIPAITALANAYKEQAAAGAAASVAGIPIAGAAMAVAAVASVIASLAAIPKFAKGGIAYGPTLGMFGEYAGASHNPEIVAPLDRLRSIIGSPAGGGTVEFKIEGRTLVGVLAKQNSFNNRT